MQHGTAEQYQHAVQSKTVKAGFGARPQAVGGITSKKKKITERDSQEEYIPGSSLLLPSEFENLI
jgi:hypothetical protein